MQPKPLKQDQDNLFHARLSSLLNPSHGLLKLAKAIPWEQLEIEFKPLFSKGPSRPPLPVRLAAGLMILEHMFDFSDEGVAKAWVEKPLLASIRHLAQPLLICQPLDCKFLQSS